MSEIIPELEHILSVVNKDLKYYQDQLDIHYKDEHSVHQGFYRGGVNALVDVKSYLEKDIKRIKRSRYEK